MIPMILTAQDRNALMEAIEVIQAVQNRRPIAPKPSTTHILSTIIQRSIQEERPQNTSHETHGRRPRAHV